MRLAALCTTVLLPVTLAGQGSPPLTFEVASVKPAGGQLPRRREDGMRVQGQRAAFHFLSLANLIAIAFRVDTYQVVGPPWLASERYIIDATIPLGASHEDVPKMLKSLLQERFHMAYREEVRDFLVYTLVVGKAGLKVKRGYHRDPQADRQQETKGSMNADGTMHVTSPSMKISTLVGYIRPFLDHPVVDGTALDDIYEIAIDLPLEARLASRRPPPLEENVTSDTAEGGTSFVASQLRKIGLELDLRKIPRTAIVIDAADKVPTLN